MHKNIYIILLIWIFISFASCQAQTNKTGKSPTSMSCTDCNLVDSNGKKYGLWIEGDGYREVYYKNNNRDGFYKVYDHKNGKLLCLGEYNDGNKSGKWLFFDQSGHILFTEENISENKDNSRMRDDGVRITPKFASYMKKYYLNGLLREEGQVLYDVDIEIDYYKTGTWKYYDSEGKLNQTKEED